VNSTKYEYAQYDEYDDLASTAKVRYYKVTPNIRVLGTRVLLYRKRPDYLEYGNPATIKKEEAQKQRPRSQFLKYVNF
jgi:hypothetical protein